MLRRAYRKLKLISYYSSHRRRTRWTMARDRAIAITLLLSVPALLAAEAIFIRPTVISDLQGQLLGLEDGTLYATVMGRSDRWLETDTPRGEWTLNLVEVRRGWPFPSARSRAPVRLDLNRFDRAGTTVNAKLGPESEERLAIEAALREAGRRDLLATWREQTATATETERYWIGTVTGLMVWWVMLALPAFLLLRALALGWTILTSRKLDRGSLRAARGRCAECNYDLRGLEFRARCPECGRLIE